MSRIVEQAIDHINGRSTYEVQRELAALGLDPHHTEGLLERARVYDCSTQVEAFIGMHPGTSKYNRTASFLKRHGITPDQKHLGLVLAAIKRNAKAINKKKTPRRINYERQEAEREWDKEISEVAREEAAEELAATEAARKERQDMADESFLDFLMEAFTDSETATEGANA